MGTKEQQQPHTSPTTPKHVLPDVVYEEALGEIIHRDYFSTNQKTNQVIVGPSISQFQSTYTPESHERFRMLQQQQQQGSSCTGSGSSSIGNNNNNSAQVVVTTVMGPPRPIAAGRTTTTTTGRPKTTIVPSNTRFPTTTTMIQLPTHFEGDNDDETTGDESTRLDDSVIPSIASEVRQGRERRALQQQQQTSGGGGYQLPPEDPYQVAATRWLAAKQTQKRTVPTVCLVHHRGKHQRSRSVRRGDSLGAALQAARRRRAQQTNKTSES